MKVLDVKDVKLVPQPEDSECEAITKGQQLVLPQSNVKRVMPYPSVLLVQAFNILMSFATFFVWLVYTNGGSAITREGTIFFLIASILFLFNFSYIRSAHSKMVETKFSLRSSEKAISTTEFTAVKSGNNVILDILKFDRIHDFV